MKKLNNRITFSLCCVLILLIVSTAKSTIVKDVYDIISDIDKKLRQRYDQELADYKSKLIGWINFSPSSRSGHAVNAILRPLDRIDLESAHISGVPKGNKRWDLVYGNGPGGVEYLRALTGVSWHEKGVSAYKTIKYRDIRDAKYSSPRNPRSGYTDIFNMHRSNVPGNGFVFFIKTAEGNISKFQIVGYENVMSGNQVVCRNMKICFEVFPIVPDPPVPKKPKGFFEKLKDFF